MASRKKVASDKPTSRYKPSNHQSTASEQISSEVPPDAKIDSPRNLKKCGGIDGDSASSESTSSTVNRTIGDRWLEYYKQRRDDARAYAILVFQVLTLLLTTLTIVIGWGAKDFFSQKYDIALATAAPTVYAMKNGDGRDSAGNVLSPLDYSQTQAELKSAGDRFARLVWTSPTLSIILCAGVFFLSLLLGILIVIVYVLQRRRYRSHAVEGKLGLEPDAPLYDPVLTIKSLGALGYIMAFICASAWLIMTGQCIVAVLYLWKWEMTSWPLLAGVVIAWLITTAKVLCDVVLALHSRRHEREAGWNRRWPSAVMSLANLKREITSGRVVLPEEVIEIITSLHQACISASDKDNAWKRRFTWHKEVEPLMAKLLKVVIDNKIFLPELWMSLHEIGTALCFKRRMKVTINQRSHNVRLHGATILALRISYCKDCTTVKRSWWDCHVRFKCWE